MRHSLLASVLEIVADNIRFRERIAVFDIGEIFIPRTDADTPATVGKTFLPDELRRLSIVLTGPREIPGWQGRTDTEAMDFFDLKGVVQNLLQGLHVDTVEYRAMEHASYHPGRVAQVLVNGDPSTRCSGARPAWRTPDSCCIFADHG